MNLHNVFLLCSSFYQLTILHHLLFSVFFNPSFYCHAHNSLPLDPTVSLLSPSFNLPSMPHSQVHLYSDFPNNFLWIFHQQNFDTVHYKIFSLLLLLPNHNTDIYPTSSSTSHSYITLHHRTNILKNPILTERAWQRLKWE
jgi:hypothetical protein